MRVWLNLGVIMAAFHHVQVHAPEDAKALVWEVVKVNVPILVLLPAEEIVQDVATILVMAPAQVDVRVVNMPNLNLRYL